MAVSINGTGHQFTRQDEVEEVCGKHLGSRFSLGKHATLNTSELRTKIGDLSDMDATRRILNNEYVFSDEWDSATVDERRFSLPIYNIPEDLVVQIKLWRQTGEEVVLCIDTNQDVDQKD